MPIKDLIIYALATFGAFCTCGLLFMAILFAPNIIRFFIEEFGAMIRDEIRYKYQQFMAWLRRIRPSELMMNLIMAVFALAAIAIIVGTLRANILALF